MEVRKLSRLDKSLIILAVLFPVILVVVLPEAMRGGPISAFALTFYLFTALLAVQGALVLRSVWSRSKVRTRTILIWVLSCVSLFTLAVLLVILSTSQSVVLLGSTDARSIPAPLLYILLWSLFLAIACLWMAAIAGAIWILARLLRWFLPQFLMDIKKIRYDRHDPWYSRVEAWALSIPSVLDPSSLHLETQPLDADGARQRFFQAIQWQIALGLVVAVYISLNPLLLSTLSFAETYALVSIPVGLIPLLILPWSVLEALGARIKGTRMDFYLHEGAKRRMVQTLLALGTLFLIVRLAIDKIGLELLALTFTSYLCILFILSAMVSFVYFNFFESELINDIHDRSGKLDGGEDS